MNVNGQNRCRVVVLASGEGTNAMNLVSFFNNSNEAQVTTILTNNPAAGVIRRAAEAGVKVEVMPPSLMRDGDGMVAKLHALQADFIVLAGYLKLIPEAVIRAFRNRIINIHPALLPRFGGKGMFGSRVHDAVIAAGDTESGITIHQVNEEYDKGEIIAQFRLTVQPGWDAVTLQKEIHELEYRYFPVTIQQFIQKTLASSKIQRH
jgi:phosphoribosylglycinamide formyltransferase 1